MRNKTPQNLYPQFAYAIKKSWFLFPVVGIINYLLISKGIESGYLNYLPSRIILTAIFPASCLYIGIVVGINLIFYMPKKRKR